MELWKMIEWTEAASFQSKMMKNLFPMEHILCWKGEEKWPSLWEQTRLIEFKVHESVIFGICWYDVDIVERSSFHFWMQQSVIREIGAYRDWRLDGNGHATCSCLGNNISENIALVVVVKRLTCTLHTWISSHLQNFRELLIEPKE